MSLNFNFNEAAGPSRDAQTSLWPNRRAPLPLTPEQRASRQACREASLAYYGYDREAYLESRGPEYRARVAHWHPEGLHLRKTRDKGTQTDPLPEPSTVSLVQALWRRLLGYFAQ